MNFWDVLIIAVIAAAVFFAVRAVVKQKKKGQCSCGCSGCPGGVNCRGCSGGESTGEVQAEKEVSPDDRA